MRKILLLSSILIAIAFHSCIDDPIFQQGIISGIVYDRYGMPNRYTFISIGDYPIIGVDRFGTFSIDNTLHSYNLTIADDNVATKYLGLTTRAPKVCSFDEQGYSRRCYLKVSFPKFQHPDTRAFVKFISKDAFTQFDYMVHEDTVFTTNVRIMPDKDKIEGKLIFLQFKSFLDVYSYDKFGIKDVTLYPVGNQYVRFDASELSNPEEREILYNVQLSGNYSYYNSVASINFTGMNFNSTIEIKGRYEEFLSGYVKIPVLPALNYNILFTNKILFYDDNPVTPYSLKWIYTSPVENISIQHSQTIRLLLPRDGETVITDTTKFIFTDDEPGTVYVYKIENSLLNTDYISLSVVTEKHPLEFKDLKTRGIVFKPNVTYYWSVTKYPGYKSIDEFAATKYMEDTTYTSIPASASNSFIFK